MKLKELQRKSPYTIKETAKMLKIPIPTLSNYLQETRTPSLEILKKLSNFYKVSVDYIIENEIPNQLQLGYLENDKKNAIKILISLNQLNFVKAYSYLSGLYAGQ